MPVAVCFFLSGAAALILQVLWTRMLGHVFGATALAVSTTLTVFMAGLALGSHLGGKRAPKLKRPLLAFAVLETAVGAYGLAVPTMFELLPAVQRSVGLELGFWGYALFRFVMVAVILALPTTAMGATLPILAQGVVERSERMAAQVGTLYAANTFGAVAGAFAAGFWLIPELGIETTVYLAAAIDLTVAVLVVTLFSVGGRALLLRRVGERGADEVLEELEPQPHLPVTPAVERATLFVFAASGAAAMALEVLWTRAVGVVIGASTYSFTLILTTFLVGLAVGAAVTSAFVERLKTPVRALAWVEAAVGLTAIVASVLIDRVPFWLLSTAQAPGVTMDRVYVTNFFIAAAVTFPSTLALGAVMPLVVRILAPSGESEAGRVVGRAYALNTLGAIVGSFAGGFIILPLLGVERGLYGAALVSLALGVGLAWAAGVDRKRLTATLVAAVLVVVLMPGWDVRRWTAGMFRMYLAKSVFSEGWQPYGKVVYHRDGIVTTVTVEQQDDGVGVSLKVNGKVDASDIGDMPTQVLSGLLPVILHSGPKSALVIGYGSGVTPGAVLKVDVEQLRVAEIEDAVYEASNTLFSHVNGLPGNDPRCRLVVDDGRNFLLTRQDTYDVIISEPSNPWMSGAASLFTQDFFRIAKARLNEGGVFLQWLQLYELDPANIHALIRTFHSVFPYVLVFTPDPTSNDTFLVGAEHPLKLSRERLQTFLRDPKLGPELARAKVDDPDDFFGLFLMGSDEVGPFVGEGPINTDDNALIEYAAPKDLLTYAIRDARIPFLEAVEGHRLEMTRKYFEGWRFDGPELARLAQALLRQGRLVDAAAFANAAEEAGEDVARLRRLIEYLDENDDEPVVVANTDTKGDELYARAVLDMMNGNERDALARLDSKEGSENQSLAHRFLYAYLCYRNQRLGDAEFLIERVVDDETFVANNPSVLYYAGRVAMYSGRFEDGVGYLERFDDARLSETATVAAP
ncbi:MAG: fused MFS/spermidine synthase [Myxococcales bacterium]|nr:fused MFS/spermidine synthase [Myxococcales bacterium]